MYSGNLVVIVQIIIVTCKNKQLTTEHRQCKNTYRSIFKRCLEYAQEPFFIILKKANSFHREWFFCIANENTCKKRGFPSTHVSARISLRNVNIRPVSSTRSLIGLRVCIVCIFFVIVQIIIVACKNKQLATEHR